MNGRNIDYPFVLFIVLKVRPVRIGSVSQSWLIITMKMTQECGLFALRAFDTADQVWLL